MAPHVSFNPIITKKPSRIMEKAENSSKNQPIEVFCRLRPIKNTDDHKVIHIVDDERLQVQSEGHSDQVYKFKHIFNDDASQNDIFSKVAFPLIKDWYHGQNGLLFTYGVTSSGKTHTITGNPQNPGLLPRVLDVAFNTLKNCNKQTNKLSLKSDGHNGFVAMPITNSFIKHQTSSLLKNYDETIIQEWKDHERSNEFLDDICETYNYSIFISYVENYNKYIYDLLEEKPKNNKPEVQKQVRENSKKQVFIQGLTEIEVKTSEKAFALFLKGNQRKKIASTNSNSKSSRSHSIFTLRLVQIQPNINKNGTLSHNSSNMIITQLSIVDLAGCERTHKTGAIGDRLKEAGNINNSLLTLRSCFEALRENQKGTSTFKKLIPYRDSRLTLLFKNFFEGNGQVKMILCIDPGSKDFDETLNVLKFGELSQDVMIAKNREIQFHDYIFSPLTPWPENWLEDPTNENILNEWKSINDQRNSDKKKINNFYLKEMKKIREEIINLDRGTLLFKEENARLGSDFVLREETNKQLKNEIISLQRLKECDKKKIISMQQNLNQLKNKISLAENQRSKTQNHFRNLKDNIETFFESHRKETNKVIFRMMKNKEIKLREMECINKVKFEIAAKILQDTDEELMRSMKNFSAEKIWNSIQQISKRRYE